MRLKEKKERKNQMGLVLDKTWQKKKKSSEIDIEMI